MFDRKCEKTNHIYVLIIKSVTDYLVQWFDEGQGKKYNSV